MEQCEEGAKKLIPSGYVSQGLNALRTHDKALKHLIEQRRLPERGWSELDIERCVNELSAMDTNNFTGNVGGGEREGRVYSALVSRRHYHLAHGMGRSGDIAANQPKV